MRNLSVVLAGALLMLLGTLIVVAQDDGAANAQIDALVKASSAREIGRIDIFRLPKHYESVVAVRPEDLERLWHYKMTIRELRAPKEELIVGALRAAKVRSSDREWDLRRGVVFYSRSGDRRIAALYFDETGRYGSVDKIPVSFGADFFPRLKNALHLSIE